MGCGLSSEQQHHTQEIEAEHSNRPVREGKRRRIHILNLADVVQEVFMNLKLDLLISQPPFLTNFYFFIKVYIF